MAAAEAGRGGLRFLDRREEERFLGWPELVERGLRVAGGLAAEGIRPGDRVALVFPTGEEFFDACFGALLAGAVPVPLYPPVRLGRLGEYHARTGAMLSAAGAKMLLTDRRVGSLLGESVERAGPDVVFRTLERLPAGEPPPLAGSSDDLGLVQFSSGTTVEPKPVALSHRALLAQLDVLNRHWRHIEGVSGVSWLPLYHDMGLIGCIFPAAEHGAELTLLPPELFVAKPALWLRALSRYRAEVSPAPNFAYALCVERVRDEEMEGVDLSSWRVALNGAESVAPAVLRRFVERFGRWGFRPEALSPVYGLSEAALAVTFSDLERPFETLRVGRERLAQGHAEPDEEGLELVSVGRPLPGFTVEIRDEEGTSLPEGRVGRVWIAGPSLMDGYLGRPEETARVLVDGWLDSGDLGFLSGGELYLTGRAKDVLILRGRNYRPEDVEHAVDGVDGVRTGCTAAVSWLPEGEDGERLVLFVETARELRGDAEGLVAACRERVLEATGLRPAEVVPLEPGTLPRTSSGKIRRAEALRRWSDGTLEAPDRVTPLRLLGAMARSRLALARHRRGGDE
ncbi:MAG: fatty acyl-AMP ligase [Thermoanaerobaculia bacterium]